MTSEMGFYVDLRKCVGCRSCEAACETTWQTSPGIGYRKVGTLEAGEFPTFQRLFMSLSCNHCEAPACAAACPTDAYTKHPDGVVTVDSGTCIGCKMCTFACPYGAPQYDKVSGTVSKCNFCKPLLDAGQAPACVASCPYDALDHGPMDELVRRHPTAQRTAPFFPDPSRTRPNILFDVPDDDLPDIRRVDDFARLADQAVRRFS